MTMMAVLAVLVGGIELLNAVVAAGAAARVGSSVAGLAVFVVLGMVSALLLVSGVALLARRRGAITFARAAALACLILFAAVAAFWPVLSIIATALGIAFPGAMLLFLLRPTTAKSSRAGA